MDQTIVDNINAVVSTNDVLYFLGDFSMGPMAPFREQINCNNIHLIAGNHDRQVDRKLFVSVRDINEFRQNSLSIILCHYAFLTWNKKCHGSYSLFGHSHNTLEGVGLSFDCGVDTNNFAPYSLDDVMRIMEAKKAQFTNSV